MNRSFSKFLIFVFLLTSHYGICLDPVKDNQQREKLLIQHVRNSIASGALETSKLSNHILDIHGFSSRKIRQFLNNVCALPNANYLEIGLWKGSTWISALYLNQETMQSAIGIDNWSQNGPWQDFMANCSLFLPGYPYELSFEDCFKFDTQKIVSPINIFFYDGDHSASSHELAFYYFNNVLDDIFIAIVDDWNFPDVAVGTKTAFANLKYEILFEVVLPANYNADKDNWWNGLYVAVIKKPKE